MKLKVIVSILVLSSIHIACEPPVTALSTCELYLSVRNREAKLRKRTPVAMNCAELARQYETKCTPADLSYAHNAFKQDLRRLFEIESVEDLATFKSAFDPSQISAACNQNSSVTK